MELGDQRKQSDSLKNEIDIYARQTEREKSQRIRSSSLIIKAEPTANIINFSSHAIIFRS